MNFSPTLASVAVEYESGVSCRPSVGRSTFHSVFPDLASIASTYDGSSVNMPCKFCRYSTPWWSRGEDP